MAARLSDPPVPLAPVLRWWRVVRPPPSAGRRAELIYTTALVTAIFGALVYGAASSALAEVVSRDALARWGVPLALVALLLVARWGTVQGPVVFAVPDVTHLLGAPLRRRDLATRRLRRGFAVGAAGGAVAGGIVVVGLAGNAPVETADGAALVAGAALAGVPAVAAAWAVQASARGERLARLATWPIVAIAAALAWADAGTIVRPVPALVVLAAVATAAAVPAMRRCGDCPTERHLRRAEGRAGAFASVLNLDVRTARRSLLHVRGPGAGGITTHRLRRALGQGGAAAVVWRDAVTTLRAPQRVAQGAVLGGGGTALALLDSSKAGVVAAASVLVYAGAGRLLESLRAELDVPARSRVLLGLRPGRALLAHTVVPAAVLAAAAVVATAACAGFGDVTPGAAAAAILATPAIASCAAMSARRGGRLPVEILFAAAAGDPTGGVATVSAWLLAWPAAAAACGVIALQAGAAGAVLALGTAALLARLLDRDPA